MRVWVEDESRLQFALWFGKFKSADELKRYAFNEFRKDLQIPMSWELETFYLRTSFASRPNELSELIGQLKYSKSFLASVKKATSKQNLSKYNGAIAIFDYFTEDDISQDARRADFIGYFKYDMRSDSIIADKPSYLNDQRVSVWFGTFPSKAEFESYFCLPDHVPPEEDFEFKNPFAEDFKIPTYNSDVAAYNLARAMKQKEFKELVSPIPMSQKLLKSMVKAAAEQNVKEGNAVYVAFRLDYEDLKSNLKKKPRSRYDFKYLGSFHDPGLPKNKR